jgi:hypothetical protein
LLEETLAAAERQLAEAQCHLANLREHLSRLEREAIDIPESSRLLIELEEVLAMYAAGQDRLRKQLGL